METNGTMTQEQLRLFVQKEARKRLFDCPPFNIRYMLGTAVVCLLFPGIVLGQRRAIGVTIALLVCLLATWLWDAPVWLHRLLLFWGIWSGCAWLIWQFLVFLLGWGAWCRSRRWQRPSNTPATEAVCTPWEYVLHWKPETDTRYVSRFTLHAERRGLYLLELKLNDEAAGELSWEGISACYEETEILPGVQDKRHAVFRLEPGCHSIRLILNTDKLPVKATLSQLNHV